MSVEKFTVSSRYIPTSASSAAECYKAAHSFFDDFLEKIPYVTLVSREPNTTQSPKFLFRFGDVKQHNENYSHLTGEIKTSTEGVVGNQLCPPTNNTTSTVSKDFYIITSKTGDKLLCGLNSVYSFELICGDVIFWNARNSAYEHNLLCIGSSSEIGFHDGVHAVIVKLNATTYNSGSPTGGLGNYEDILQPVYTGYLGTNLYRSYRNLSPSKPGMVYQFNDGNSIRNMVCITGGILVEI